ncbi:hypothetical protein NUKP48_40060 [Klebsiella quasipneumoniae]|nr:hypothetical protein NUKP48_40060 [Klebsiella quasipneumoniae]
MTRHGPPATPATPSAGDKSGRRVNETSYFPATLLAKEAKWEKDSEKNIRGSAGADASHAQRQRVAGTGSAACRQRPVRLV